MTLFLLAECMLSYRLFCSVLCATLAVVGCGGNVGSTGAVGIAGQDSNISFVNTDNEPAGQNCANGGSRISAGLDSNRNNLLDASEITQSRYACNGSAGSDGSAGTNASRVLVKTAAEPAGHQCASGGFSIRVGLDTNSNNVLDAAEVSSTDYACNGVAGQNGTQGLSSLISTGSEAAGVNCAHGGTRFSTGLDINSNTVLDAGEITSSSYACNGSPGSNGNIGSNATQGTNGSNALNSLILTTSEPAGINCGSGGLRVQAGLDTNRSGVLDATEIVSTLYICNDDSRRNRNWRTSAPIENDNTGTALAPQIAIDDSGAGLAVWQQSDGTRFNIWANRFSSSTGWGTATLIETSNGGDASSPQIAIDAQGDALAVWQQVDSLGVTSIYANRFTQATSSWGNAVTIETGGGSASTPDIAMDGVGNALVVWSQSDGLRTHIWANRFTHATRSWGVATQIENGSAGNASSPQIAVNLSGNAMAVWEQQDSLGRINIWANRFTPNIGWDTAVIIETVNTGDAQAPQIAMDASSNAVAVWSQSDGVRLNIWTNRFTTVGRWGTAALIESNDLGNAISPQVTIDHNGDTLAVWAQNDGTRSRIYFNRFPAGSNGWGRSELIDTDTSGTFNQANSFTPHIALDTKGDARVVWRRLQGTSASIVVNSFTPTSGWSFPQLLDGSNTFDLALPQIAMNASGNALVVWQQSDGTRLNIMHNSFQ